MSTTKHQNGLKHKASQRMKIRIFLMTVNGTKKIKLLRAVKE